MAKRSNRQRTADQREFISLCWLAGMTVSSTEELLFKRYGKEAVPIFVRMLWQLRFDQMQKVGQRNVETGLGKEST